MRKLLLRSTIIIAAIALISMNIQLLFNTSENALFNQSTVKAQQLSGDSDGQDYTIEYMLIRSSEFKRYRFLKNARCYNWDFSIGGEITWVVKYIIPEISDFHFNIATAGMKLVCRYTYDSLSFCQLDKQTDCKEASDEEGDVEGGNQDLN